jgi:hypothetical protein
MTGNLGYRKAADMGDLGLSSLSSVQLAGQYGQHLTALIWLTVSAALMYVGPATVSFIYLLLYDRSEIGTVSVEAPLSSDEEKEETLKAA